MDDPDVKIADIRTGQLCHELIGHTGNTFATDWHSDENYVATGNEDFSTLIWDLRTEKPVYKLCGTNGRVGSIKFVRNSQLLIVGDYSNTLRVYDTRNYSGFSEVNFKGRLQGFDSTEDGRSLFVGVDDITSGRDTPGGVLELETSLDGFEMSCENDIFN